LPASAGILVPAPGCRRAVGGVGLHSSRAQASGRMPKAAGWKTALPFGYTRMGIFGVGEILDGKMDFAGAARERHKDRRGIDPSPPLAAGMVYFSLFFSRLRVGRVIIAIRMKKTFPLRIPDKSDSRVIAAIEVTLNKYVKRERKKALPAGADRWDFQCRVGANPETARPCELAELPAGIEAVASAQHPGVYVEILAEPGRGQRTKAAGTERAEKGGER